MNGCLKIMYAFGMLLCVLSGVVVLVHGFESVGTRFYDRSAAALAFGLFPISVIAAILIVDRLRALWGSPDTKA